MQHIEQEKYAEVCKRFFPEKSGWDMLSCCVDTPAHRGFVHLFVDCAAAARSVAVQMGDFLFLGGVPDEKFLRSVVDRSGLLLIGEHWLEMAQRLLGQSRRYLRYRMQLKNPPSQLPPLPVGCSLEPIGPHWFAECQKTPWMRDFCSQFACFAQYQRYGMGFVLVRDGQALSGASSYLTSPTGFTIQVQTREDCQRQGLARIVSTALIQSACAKHLYPDWDADNRASLMLAESLGYVLEEAYPTVLVEGLEEGKE